MYSEVAGTRALVRNLVLAALAGVLVIHGPGPAIDEWVAEKRHHVMYKDESKVD